jgi:hypothetical protein
MLMKGAFSYAIGKVWGGQCFYKIEDSPFSLFSACPNPKISLALHPLLILKY